MTLLWKFMANGGVIISILLKPAPMNIDCQASGIYG